MSNITEIKKVLDAANLVYNVSIRQENFRKCYFLLHTVNLILIILNHFNLKYGLHF